MTKFRIEVLGADLEVTETIFTDDGNYVSLSYTELKDTAATYNWLNEAINKYASGEITSITLHPTKMLVEFAPETDIDYADDILSRFFEMANELAIAKGANAQYAMVHEEPCDARAVSSVNAWDVNNK